MVHLVMYLFWNSLKKFQLVDLSFETNKKIINSRSATFWRPKNIKIFYLAFSIKIKIKKFLRENKYAINFLFTFISLIILEQFLVQLNSYNGNVTNIGRRLLPSMCLNDIVRCTFLAAMIGTTFSERVPIIRLVIRNTYLM